MLITHEEIDQLKTHWAVGAIPLKDREKALRLANEHLVNNAVGRQICFSFASEVHRLDTALMDRVLSAYEVAALEGIDELGTATESESDVAKTSRVAAHVAFSLIRCLPVPSSDEERMFTILKASAIAYCGDRWSDIRDYYNVHAKSIKLPSFLPTQWDNRILYRLFDCWSRLFRKDGWDDLHGVLTAIAELRSEQAQYEAQEIFLNPAADGRLMAFRLVSMYHWARATELLATFVTQGDNMSICVDLDKHFESAITSAEHSGDMAYELLLHWLHATSILMVKNSLWWGTRTVNSRVTKFVKSVTRRDAKPIFEMLPPQRAALLECGLLDQAKTAVVVDLPTSGGKTLLAQFRILQALNQFNEDKGWVAYVAPTKALVAQITRRLRRDFDPIGIRVEQLTAAVEIDAFEEKLLTDGVNRFDVLVATPEKMSLLVRNNKVPNRPLALIVLDEAHNIEHETRGMRIEFLLSTVKQDCPRANFLLLMPSVPGSEELSRWLAQDTLAAKSISLGTTAWRPNERIIGLYRAVRGERRSDWHLEYETLTCTPRTLQLKGKHRVTGNRPFDLAASNVISGDKQVGLTKQTAIMAAELSDRGTSIAIGRTPDDAWRMARFLAENLNDMMPPDPDVVLVQKFLRTEVDKDFELIGMLDKGIGVHHGALSDEIRSLMEWLAEEGKLRVLCATTTIAQGINFPVSSIFMASKSIPLKNASVDMPERDFWNLVGRAGRLGQDCVGVVGLAQGESPPKMIKYISQATEKLASRLERLLDDLERRGKLNDLKRHLHYDEWEDFRSYIAHLYKQKQNLEETLAASEQFLRQTLGYSSLAASSTGETKAAALLDATKSYVRDLSGKPGIAALADATGFSPEGVGQALRQVNKLKQKLHPDDWMPESLFGSSGHVGDVFGAILKVNQLKRNLEEFTQFGCNEERLGDLTRDWVNGSRIVDIAKKYFSHGDSATTEELSKACKTVYKSIVNNCTWGVSAMSHLPGATEDLDDEQQRKLNSLPAMVYHGVNTEEAVLMRMNNVPRSAATKLGELYKQSVPHDSPEYFSAGNARAFVKGLQDSDWANCAPRSSALNGAEFRKIWSVLSGDFNPS